MSVKKSNKKNLGVPDEFSKGEKMIKNLFLNQQFLGMGIIHYLVMCLAQVVLDNNYCQLKNQIGKI